MRKQELLSEDPLIISRHKAQSSDSVREYSYMIPIDLLINIFSRVPAKSIAKFRCVSKFWASILIRPDFTELFFTKSSNQPRFLFIICVNEEALVFSSPQPHNLDENCSLVATRYKSFPERFPTDMFQQRYGLIFLQKNNERVIYNPITGKFIILPKLKVKVDNGVCYLCYDPTNKQFKVLCIMWSLDDEGPNTHWVLTLGTSKRCWKLVESISYSPGIEYSDGICINGMLYYRICDSIVCFDVRYEKFSFISIDMFEVKNFLTLTNYKGKLGVHRELRRLSDTELVLWVLEDVVNNKWSKEICVLTPFWNMIIDKDITYRVRVTHKGEIVFFPYSLSYPFYIFYYNFERKTFTRVEIQGFQEFVPDGIYVRTFLDYVENMKLVSEDDDGCRRSKRPRKPICYFEESD